MSLISEHNLKACRKLSPDCVPIAFLDYKNDKSLNTLICYSDNKKIGVKEIRVDPAVITVRPIPFKVKGQRVCVNITGSSGSGKSVFLANLLRYSCLYDSTIEDNLLITSVEEPDEAFDLIIEDLSDKKKEKYRMQRLNIPACMEADIKIDQMANSNIIFDDYFTFTNKAQDDYVLALQKSLLEKSRKLNCNVFVINHDARDFNKTKLCLLESQTFVCFPKSNRDASVKLLTNYSGLNRRVVDYITSIDNGRFTFLMYQKNPSYIISQDRIELL